MAEAQTTVELVGRKQVRLRSRPNLRYTTREEGGRRIHIVKDPVSLQYFHLDEAQRFALGHMDGRHTLEEIQQAFEQDFRPQRLSLAELEAFASQLLQRGLVETQAGDAGRQLYRRLQKTERLKRWASLFNVFYIKVPLLNPNNLLGRLAPVARVLFHPLFLAAAGLALLGALALIITRWDAFQERLPSFQEFFSFRSLIYLWLAFGLVKILHELGHGLCAKHVGGDVHEMGVVFLFFFPTLYCNVTDTCTLPRKWKRMAVSAAGIYVELLVAATAVFCWWLTGPNTFAHNFCFGLILVCSVHTLLFNANPLMRFDGYFILADWMEIPNMAQAAGRRVKDTLCGWLGMRAAATAVPGPARFLLGYGIASLVYRCIVTSSVLWVCYLFLKDKRLEWLGLSLVLFALLAMLIWPVLHLVQAIKKQGAVFEVKSSRVWLGIGLLATIVLIVGFVRWPMKVRGVALVQVEPDHQYRLMVPSGGGILEQICVVDGQRVRKGDILLVLRNPELERRLRLNEMEQALRLEQRQLVLAQLAAPARTESESYQEVEHALTALAQQHAALKAQRDALTVSAPVDGVMLNLPRWDAKGKWHESGEPLCVVGDAACLRAAVLVEPADRQLLSEGSTAWFVGHGGGRLIPGTLSAIAQVDDKAIPPQLASRSGGDVVTRQDPATKAEQPHAQHFLVTVRLPEAAPVHVGVLGRVRIDSGSATLWWRFQRWFGSTFRG